VNIKLEFVELEWTEFLVVWSLFSLTHDCQAGLQKAMKIQVMATKAGRLWAKHLEPCSTWIHGFLNMNSYDFYEFTKYEFIYMNCFLQIHRAWIHSIYEFIIWWIHNFMNSYMNVTLWIQFPWIRHESDIINSWIMNSCMWINKILKLHMYEFKLEYCKF